VVFVEFPAIFVAVGIGTTPSCVWAPVSVAAAIEWRAVFWEVGVLEDVLATVNELGLTAVNMILNKKGTASHRWYFIVLRLGTELINSIGAYKSIQMEQVLNNCSRLIRRAEIKNI